MFHLLLLAAALQVSDTTCVGVGRTAVDSVARTFIPEQSIKTYQARNITRLDSLIVARCAAPQIVHDTVRVVYFDTVYVPTIPDSIIQEPPPKPDSIIVDFNHTSTALWPTGHAGALTNGTGTICASVLVDGVLHLGDQAVDARIVSQDSVAFTVRSETPSTGLRQLCAPTWDANGKSLLKATPVWPVAWQSNRVVLYDIPVAVPTPLAVIP